MNAVRRRTTILARVDAAFLYSYQTADWAADDRRHLLTTGMGEYTRSGVIGRSSLGSVERGKAVLASLVDSFAPVLEILRRDT